MIRLEGQRAIEARERLAEAFQALQHVRGVDARCCVIGFQGDCAAEGLECLDRPTEVLELRAAVVERLCGLRIE